MTTTVHGRLKTYDELTPEQQRAAIHHWVNEIIEQIINWNLTESWFGDDQYAKMVAAMEQANRMGTPWFTADYLMDAAGDAIRATAIGHALGPDVLYNTENVYIVEV